MRKSEHSLNWRMIFNLKGKLINFDEHQVMGIVNTSPESFYQAGNEYDLKSIFKLVEKHISEGANILDVGGVSTKPFAPIISKEEEWSRLKDVLANIAAEFPEILISLDTTSADIVEKALDSGIHLVNDISGLSDINIVNNLNNYSVGYILTHSKGDPQTMQIDPQYKNITSEIISYFIQKLELIKEQNLTQIILDPGIGFGKTIDHNYQIINELSSYKMFDLPIMVGLSRKSFLYKELDIDANEALNATSAAHMVALQNGAKILRVHDVKEAMQCVKIFNKFCHN